MASCSSQDLAKELGLTVSRISQLKSTGIFDGCFTVSRNRVIWEKEKALKAYMENNPFPVLKKVSKKDDIQIPSFNESKAKSEYFRAELARLELGVREEKLIEADLVEREAFTVARAVRDSLGNLPDRLSNQFAAETDPVVIHQILTTEVRKALEVLTDA
tara:strand:- start:22 stop:501 length:480 start_codon:yes stop_codon:yes gene_type:complete